MYLHLRCLPLQLINQPFRTNFSFYSNILYSGNQRQECPNAEFSGPRFPVFGLNSEIYGVTLHIRENTEQKNLYFSIFHAVRIETLAQNELKIRSK